jgi:hypothetical protein
MNTPIWIAIATTIATLITSWSQFWLKERSEKKRALAAENPATNQPNMAKPEGNARLRRSRSVLVSRIWLGASYFGANWLSLLVILYTSPDLFNGSPLTFRSVLMLLVSVFALFSSNMLLWRSTPVYPHKIKF